MATEIVTVAAKVDFEYQGRRYRTGQAVSVKPIEALMLARRDEVTLDPTKTPKRRRTYRRRDLTAEPA